MNQTATAVRKGILAKRKPRFIAIVGGSAAGKSWLADQLHKAFGKEAARLSLDDFYRDRSHLTPASRARINFDHPRAIDWVAFGTVLQALGRGQPVRIPQYDFTTHSRRWESVFLKPKPIILVDGLWLLHSRKLRCYFDVAIFLDCPEKLRLQRRLIRDCGERGREKAQVKLQFCGVVAPMHERFVAPQRRHADVVFAKPPTIPEVKRLIERLQQL